MTFEIPTINHEQDRKKRWVIGTQPTLIIEGTMWDLVTLDHPIQDDVVEKAMRILKIMSEEYEMTWLSLDAFRTADIDDIPQRKLFIAWELVDKKSDLNCSGDIVMYNWLKDISWNTWDKTYLPEPTKINLHLPLGDYAPRTRNFVNTIWKEIDSIVETYKDWPLIIYREGWESKLIWDAALKKSKIDLKKKPKYSPDLGMMTM